MMPAETETEISRVAIRCMAPICWKYTYKINAPRKPTMALLSFYNRQHRRVPRIESKITSPYHLV